MSVSMVRVKVKKECVPEMEQGIRDLVSALEHHNTQGVRYAYGRLDDGVTFVGILELEEGTDNPLPGFDEGRAFQQHLRSSWIDQTEAPVPGPFSVVASYGLFG